MKKLFLMALMAITTASSFALTIEEGKTYKISNRNDNNLYVKDAGDGKAIAMGSFDDNSYWKFEAAPTPGCFYIKNVVTGRYAQECPTTTEQPVLMGTTPVEYSVVDCSASEGENCFGLTSMNQSVTDFTANCIGWNWKNDNTVQTFAAVAGTNHRSFWKITEESYVAPDYWPLDGKVYRISNEKFQGASYMKDNGWDNNFIACDAASNAYSYWKFTKTANEYCYTIQNTATGRYIQGYKNSDEADVTLGNTPAEFIVKSFSSEEDCYGIAFTGNDPHDFTTTATKGLNLRKDPNEDGCCVQAYQAHESQNHRSFWKLQQANSTSINVSAAGYATFVAPFDVTVPAEVEAYAVDGVETGYVTLAQVTEVPACQAVVVKADEGNYQATMIASATAIETNELKATRSALEADVAFKYYILANDTEGVGFYPVQSGTTIAAGKGYIEVTSAGAKAMLRIGGETNTIEGVIVNKLDGTSAIYNLAGQKLQNLKKGVNIVNGKTILVK